MNQLKFLLIIFISIASNSCTNQDCKNIQRQFENHQQATETVRSAKFKLTDKINTHKSSWIVKAEYYSCDGNKGYFLITTKKKTYIHQDLPKELWIEFKKASSFGRFYNGRIRGRYQIDI